MKKNKVISICLFGVIGIFTIMFFVLTNKASYAFNTDYETELYNIKINSIEQQAKTYGESNKDLFKENKDAYITVDDLAKLGFMITDNGKVIDPRNEEKNLNNIKIRLTYKNDDVTAKVLV